MLNSLLLGIFSKKWKNIYSGLNAFSDEKKETQDLYAQEGDSKLVPQHIIYAVQLYV